MIRKRSAAHGRVRNRTRAPAIAAGIVILAVIGLSLLGLSGLFSTADGQGAPGSGAPSSASTAQAGPSEPTTLARSNPTRLAIASIGVDSGLQALGMSKNEHVMQLPPNPKQAGWYDLGPTPGEAGPTIIVGYITSPHGPGVFRRLADLTVHAAISVTRADGRIVTYRVDAIDSYPKGKLPTSKVYATSADPTLRLITTGGTLHQNQKAGNVVVYAHQVSIRKPSPVR